MSTPRENILRALKIAMKHGKPLQDRQWHHVEEDENGVVWVYNESDEPLAFMHRRVYDDICRSLQVVPEDRTTSPTPKP